MARRHSTGAGVSTRTETPMNPQSLLAIALATFVLTGCAGGGPMLAEPAVSQSDVSQARQALAKHRIAPSRNSSIWEMGAIVNRAWKRVKPPISLVCTRTFSHRCDKAMRRMQLKVVPDESVNAYADASTFTIGVHRGLLRSAGSDDEIAWVLAHEAAHLLFGHTQKKMASGTNAQLLTGALALALGAATQSHTILKSAGDISMTGYQAGYLAYSPAMEIEADQFAAFVLKHADMRPEATLDMIVRMHRGDVPAPVRRGEGWAGYLATHPADDYRLAAMQSTLARIRAGATRPLSKQEALKQARRAEERQRQKKEIQLAKQKRERYAVLCKELTREYPNCKWWNDEYDWKYIVRCPLPLSKKAREGYGSCVYQFAYGR